MDQEKLVGEERFLLMDIACARYGLRRKQLLQLCRAHKVRRFEEPLGPAQTGRPPTAAYVCESELRKALEASREA
ncbi:MAG: hypothetical protein AB1503_00370 [Bacillota bacterium]|nr:hypothetical protein [Bacillota bacterium]